MLGTLNNHQNLSILIASEPLNSTKIPLAYSKSRRNVFNIHKHFLKNLQKFSPMYLATPLTTSLFNHMGNIQHFGHITHFKLNSFQIWTENRCFLKTTKTKRPTNTDCKYILIHCSNWNDTENTVSPLKAQILRRNS